jgi:hypothetical protein
MRAVHHLLLTLFLPPWNINDGDSLHLLLICLFEELILDWKQCIMGTMNVLELIAVTCFFFWIDISNMSVLQVVVADLFLLLNWHLHFLSLLSERNAIHSSSKTRDVNRSDLILLLSYPLPYFRNGFGSERIMIECGLYRITDMERIKTELGPEANY